MSAWGSSRAGPWRVAAGCGLLALVVLGLQVAADPATGVTFSQSPFTDEGWSTLGARNVALLGRWATDEWQLYLVSLPFSVIMAATFELFEVGVIQARLVSIIVSSVAVSLLSLVVARRFGTLPALITGVGLAMSSLLVYYGRLAMLEPMVMLWLVAAAVAIGWERVGTWLVPGLIAGACLALALGTKPSSAAAAVGMVAGALAAAAGSDRFAGQARRGAVALAVVGLAGAAWWALVASIPGAWDAIVLIWPDQLPASSLGEVIDRVVSYPIESDGAVRLAAPLLLGGLLGLAVMAGRWRSLAPGDRIMVGACVGWFVVGMLVLVVVPYRPNRYVVPLLPPLALLTGLGAWGILPIVRRRLPWRWAPAALAVMAAFVLGAQGAWHLGRWTAHATYDLPRIQAEVLHTMTDGHAVQGAGPTMAMRVPVPAIVVQSDINDGDLYASHGVRWLLSNRDAVPTWADEHPDAWAQRELLTCYSWPSGEACLVRIP